MVLCGDDGGRFLLGGDHACLCVRTKGHPNDSDRPHSCGYGSMWGWRDYDQHGRPREHLIYDPRLARITEIIEATPRDPRYAACQIVKEFNVTTR